MNKFYMLAAAAGTLILGSSAVIAQEMTLAGAQVLMSTIPGMTDCTTPGAAPVIPDGATVAEEAIMGAIGEFQTHMTDSETYRTCLLSVATEAGDSITDQQNLAVTMVHDDNAEKIEILGAAMNEEIRAYNVANPSN